MPPLSSYFIRIHEKPKVGNGSIGGSLSLLPAGWRYKERFAAYGQSVQAFDWEGFYASYRGKEYFSWLRSKLLAEAQVVLIDSRTGVTEMGGVCTREMADVVVSLAAPNNQNIDGVARMVRTFRRPETLEARDKRKIETIIVPTRVDPSELADLARFRERFERLADEKHTAPEDFRSLGKAFWDLQIPYRAKFSYQERRVVGPGSVADPTNGLENAYWKLACHLALLAPETHVVRQRFADLLQREFPALLPKVVVSSMPDAARDLATVQSYLRSAGIKLWPDLSHQNDLDDLQSSARVITQAAHLVVVLSPQARANNGIIRRELRFARQQGKTRVVVALSGTRPACTWLDPSEVYLSLTPELLERLRTSPRGLRAPVLVPAVAPGYVERREVQQQLKIDLLEAAVATSRTVVAVWGRAGSGKTAVVSRWCQDEDIVDTFQGGIFFVNAGETAPGKRILSAISPEATIPEDPAAAMSLAGSLLQGQRFLLIIDDVWGEKEIATLMSVTEPCAVIVLTRDLKVAATLTEKVVTLSMLTPEEAATFLPGGTETAERLGRLPLALSLARAALQQEGTFSRSAPEALQSLAQRVERHGIAAFDRPEGDRNLSIARSIEYTLTHLQNWERKRFEQLVKLVDQGKTTLDSVQQLWVNLQPGIGEPRPLTRRLMEALCQKLSELSLIEWEPEHPIDIPTVSHS
jgi:hypothetical protein